MAATCWNSIRGKVARITKVDSCCYPVAGTCSTVVTSGFVKVDYAAEISEGEDVEVKNANGALCLTDKGCDTLKDYKLTIDFCAVDPDLFTLMTGQPVVLDYAGVSVGMRTGTAIPCEGGFALETWSDIPNAATCTDVNNIPRKNYGYFLLPCLTGGTLQGFSVENAAASFQITATTRAPSTWGRGPYNVVPVDAAQTPGRLLTAIQPTEHMHLQTTTTPPPTASCGCLPLTLPVPYTP